MDRVISFMLEFLSGADASGVYMITVNVSRSESFLSLPSPWGLDLQRSASVASTESDHSSSIERRRPLYKVSSATSDADSKFFFRKRVREPGISTRGADATMKLVLRQTDTKEKSKFISSSPTPSNKLSFVRPSSTRDVGMTNPMAQRSD